MQSCRRLSRKTDRDQNLKAKCEMYLYCVLEHSQSFMHLFLLKTLVVSITYTMTYNINYKVDFKPSVSGHGHLNVKTHL